MNENVQVGDLSSDQKGISNTTIAVLVVLALVISIIGTFAVLIGTTTSPVTTNEVQYSTNVGKVSFQILPSEAPTQETQVVTENVNG